MTNTITSPEGQRWLRTPQPKSYSGDAHCQFLQQYVHMKASFTQSDSSTQLMRYEGPPSNKVTIHGLSKVAGGYECTGLEVTGYLQSGFTVKHFGSQELAVPNSAGWQPESPVTKSFAQAAGIRYTDASWIHCRPAVEVTSPPLSGAWPP